MDRRHRLDSLKQQTPFDLLVIGGGATGCGVAVDAASRGLSVALIEKNDLAEGTSSRSTKLVHGGVRYLEMAIRHLDRAQYRLVREGLDERATLLNNAPHLATRLALLTPIYTWLDVPYLFAGLLLYDLLAGRQGLGHSRLVGRRQALERFPLLRADGLKAGVVYYDGQFNDARMAVSLALTAQRHGAVVVNHLEVLALVKTGGRLAGVEVRDALGDDRFTVRARAVVNATGPFADRLRQMDDPGVAPILRASAGIHIVLARRFTPPQAGLMIPRTDDGRVLFIVPWQGHAVVGTTERAAEIVDHPLATEDEIDYLLRHGNRYFDLAATRRDVKSVWSGLRPLLVAGPTADTAQLVREHLVEVSASGLLTIAGGKWTTYRKMAEQAVDRAVRCHGLKPARPCLTASLRLVGAEQFCADGAHALSAAYGLPAELAQHLHQAYGDQAHRVAGLVQAGLGSRLHPDHPYLEAEVVHAARHEFAERAGDVLARRTPLALLDTAAARAALPRVIELMAGELGWDRQRRRAEADTARQRLSVAL